MNSWLILLPSQKTFPSSALCSIRLVVFMQHIFHIHQIFINLFINIRHQISSCTHGLIGPVMILVVFLCLFPFYYLFNFSSSSQTINQSPPARCKSSISRHLSTLLLLIYMLVCPCTLCLLPYSLILPPCLSLQCLCPEYKLHREGDVV